MSALPNIGCFKTVPDDNDVEGYVPRTATCETCNKHITQWRHHPCASFAHSDTGLFTCDEDFWTKPQASPKIEVTA